MSRTVAAIGGNALSIRADQQEMQLRAAVTALMPILTCGHEIVLVHGNGPQVGVIHGAFELAAQQKSGATMPFYDCTAMNEGAIGYHLEQALATELEKQEMHQPLATVITRVVVDPDDPAFKDPEKPVGTFYTEQEAKELEKQTGRRYGPDSGRGWRMMVPSPPPQHIIEADVITSLVESGMIVLGGGGAGIPVYRTDSGRYVPIEAVCDKDLTASMIADLIGADMLLILTAVDNVAINFGKPDQKNLSRMTPAEADTYIKQGQFPPGSMLPKVQACVRFVRGRSDRRAVIGNLKDAARVLEGTSGTVVEETDSSVKRSEAGATA